MNEKNTQIILRKDIEMKLATTNLSDLVIPYRDIAVAFPSSKPHPETFDHNLIDDTFLKVWAEELGWSVMTAPEMHINQNTLQPPIRFQKII